MLAHLKMKVAWLLTTRTSMWKGPQWYLSMILELRNFFWELSPDFQSPKLEFFGAFCEFWCHPTFIKNPMTREQLWQGQQKGPKPHKLEILWSHSSQVVQHPLLPSENKWLPGSGNETVPIFCCEITKVLLNFCVYLHIYSQQYLDLDSLTASDHVLYNRLLICVALLLSAHSWRPNSRGGSYGLKLKSSFHFAKRAVLKTFSLHC